jgi:hypothetical protein
MSFVCLLEVEAVPIESIASNKAGEQVIGTEYTANTNSEKLAVFVNQFAPMEHGNTTYSDSHWPEQKTFVVDPLASQAKFDGEHAA